MLFVRLDEKVIKKKIEMVTSSTVRRTIIITVKGTVQLKSLSPYVSDNDLDVIVIDVDVVYDYSNNDKEQL